MCNPKKLNFPILRRIAIRNFSLYAKQSEITIDVNDGVLCFAAANGLGKTTLLNIVNYGLTGVVVDTSKAFSTKNSILKFYTDNKRFAKDYFDGRIEEDSRDLAEVSLEFNVGDRFYRITRGFFEEDELREYTRKLPNESKLEMSSDTPNALFNQYNEDITRDIGLFEFIQFVFLQYYVFTFDESKQLIFWDTAVMERVLYLIFGEDAENARKADHLKKNISKNTSDMKNLQWSITQAKGEIKKLEDSISVESSANEIKLKEKYDRLNYDIKEKWGKIDKLNVSIKDLDLKLADKFLKLSGLKSEYQRLFSQYYQESTILDQHPLIVDSLNDLQCKLCNNTGDEVVKEIRRIIEKAVCPLCKANLKDRANKSNSPIMEQMKKIDNEIRKLNSKIKTEEDNKKRYESYLKVTKEELVRLESELDDIVHVYGRVIKRIKDKDDISNYDRLIEHYEKEIRGLENRKQESETQRQKNREELNKLEEKLSKRYASFEKQFISKFENYANRFLGIEVEISLKKQTFQRGTNLFLKVNDTLRQEKFQLSESQRYFIDIALRMALIEFFSDKAFLFIDTPEGSLDIAYESKAGQMFSHFAQKGYCIAMTANINTSQLLLQLARQCGHRKMKLAKMTNWAYLSEVQISEEDKIEKAFRKIEEALRSPKSKKHESGSNI
jgi:DNA repair exonuclease SbcCD ATPase subunit